MLEAAERRPSTFNILSYLVYSRYMETCRECDREFESLESVFRHQRSHGQSALDFCSRNGWTYFEWSRGSELPLAT